VSAEQVRGKADRTSAKANEGGLERKNTRFLSGKDSHHPLSKRKLPKGGFFLHYRFKGNRYEVVGMQTSCLHALSSLPKANSPLTFVRSFRKITRVELEVLDLHPSFRF